MCWFPTRQGCQNSISNLTPSPPAIFITRVLIKAVTDCSECFTYSTRQVKTTQIFQHAVAAGGCSELYKLFPFNM